MAVKLSVAQRLRVGHPSAFSFSASGIASNLAATWFCIGAKRTTGAPTTFGDLTDNFLFQLLDVDRGSYEWKDTASVSARINSLVVPTSLGASLAGDHMYLLVMSGFPPESSTTFDATKSLGTLAA